MSQTVPNVTPLEFPRHLHRKAQIPKVALCISLEAIAERAEQGDRRSPELLVESLIYLERHLVSK